MFFWVLNVSLEAYVQVSNQIEFVIFLFSPVKNKRKQQRSPQSPGS